MRTLILEWLILGIENIEKIKKHGFLLLKSKKILIFIVEKLEFSNKMAIFECQNWNYSTFWKLGNQKYKLFHDLNVRPSDDK